MKEHKQLKQICDKIGYDGFQYGFAYDNIEETIVRFNLTNTKINVVEIISTQEFMEKILAYANKTRGINYMEINNNIICNLKNPVEYLYNNLNLGNK